jgi:hypothetical protein
MAWARVELGMGIEEFDEADPRMIAAYFRAWKTRQQREDFRTATIVCSIVNLFRKTGDPIEPGDIFRSLPKAPRVRTDEEIAAKILSAFGVSEVGQ